MKVADAGVIAHAMYFWHSPSLHHQQVTELEAILVVGQAEVVGRADLVDVKVLCMFNPFVTKIRQTMDRNPRNCMVLFRPRLILQTSQYNERKQGKSHRRPVVI